MPAFPDILKRLESNDRTTVMRTVRTLIRPKFIPLPREVKEKLITVVAHCEQDETNAPLWAIVVLGERRVKEAVPALLDVFLTDADFWCEAAMDALRTIGRKFPDEVFTKTRNWIEKIMAELADEDIPDERHRELDGFYSGRVHAYAVLESLAPREGVKQYLMTVIERDGSMAEIIYGGLLRWPLHQNMRSFFRRHVALALAQGGSEYNSAYTESKWALMYTMRGETGERYEYARRDTPKPWTHWDFVFNYGEDENEKERNDAEEDEFEGEAKDGEGGVTPGENIETISEGSADGDGMTQVVNKDVWLEALEGKKDFDAFELSPFNIEEYIAVRVRTPREQKAQDMLEYYELADRWSVDSIQIQMSRARVPSEVQKPIFESVTFAGLDEARAFSHVFEELWNFTPREEFHGLTPNEKMYFASVNIHTKKEAGRNDPCPCGAVKADGARIKYKHCCGR